MEIIIIGIIIIFIVSYRTKQGESVYKFISEQAINTYKKMANIDTSEIIYQVKDIMTKDCIYIDSKSTIQDAYDILKEHKIGQIPIVSFGKKIMGIIDKKMILNLLPHIYFVLAYSTSYLPYLICIISFIFILVNNCLTLLLKI